MKHYDVVVVTQRGDLRATLDAEDNIPTTLILQAVMTHQQLAPLLANLDTNRAESIAITSAHTRLQVPPGLTLVFPNGVNINGPLLPSPISNVPQKFDGVQLTHGLAALVNYTVEPNDPNRLEPDDFSEEPDTEY